MGLDTTRDYPESFLNTAERYRKLEPAGNEPGPLICTVMIKKIDCASSFISSS